MKKNWIITNIVKLITKVGAVQEGKQKKSIKHRGCE